jgi:hypothetical protein
MTLADLRIIAGLTVAAVLSCAPGKPRIAAQTASACDHLEPRPSPVTDPGYSSSPAYESALAATLFPRVPSGRMGDEELLMVMMSDTVPAPQEAIYILTPRVGPGPVGEYRVVHARARVRVADAGPPSAADFTENFLDRDAVAALERVWTRMTAAARWRSSDEVLPAKFAIHGPAPQFIFDYWGDHVFSQGMTFSPGEGSCSATLVSIGELLERIADEPDARRRSAFRDVLMAKIGNLSNRLGIMNDGLCGGSPCRVVAPG